VRPTGGSISLDGKLVTSVERGIFLPPERRGMGMVFQTYAVWPHMTVFENVGYPVKFKKVSASTLRERVEHALSLVRLEQHMERYPHQLSGGQQQRVALARALVTEPAVLLLDEPLSNLDAKLREEMRFEITELQKRVQLTVVYVTHDQVEAMAMSDRVAIMHEGRILQLGTPREIYETPADFFVAGFIGQATFVNADVVGRDDQYLTMRVVDTAQMIQCPVEQRAPSDRVVLVIRPESVSLVPSSESGLVGTVLSRLYLGSRLDYLIQVGDSQMRVETVPTELFEEGDEVGIKLARVALLPRDSDGRLHSPLEV
jgi:iron(III) transport system ATP-binding protein